jgi:membrane protease subunit (stomatin/prohibitin family)
MMATYEWVESMKGMNIMWKLPDNIQLNDNLVVREDEIAVFYRDGKAIAYLDRPDRYALTSLDVPYVARIVEFLTGIRQDAEVYYLQKKPFDAKFGSKQPYVFKDKDFGMVNLRLFGQARWRVKDPENFISQFVGTEGLVTNPHIEERIREQIVIAVFDALGEMKERGISVTDLPANLMEIEQIVLQKAQPHFSPYGIDLQKISGLYISLPDSVLEAVDARSAMQITGTSYMQYQTGEAMRDAATQDGGAAGTGVGVGAGIGMGWQMAGTMTQPGQTPPVGAAATQPCPKCGTQNPVGQTFCGQCGEKLKVEGTKCKKCDAQMPPNTKFCGQCGADQEKEEGTKCKKCGALVPPNMKFCGQCGAPVE